MLLNWWKYQQPAKHLWKRLPFECCLLVGNTVLFGDLKSVSNRKAVECQIKHLFSYCSGNNPEFATWQTYFKCVFFFFFPHSQTAISLQPLLRVSLDTATNVSLPGILWSLVFSYATGWSCLIQKWNNIHLWVLTIYALISFHGSAPILQQSIAIYPFK